ncbi:MAG TPA: NAD(+) synthase [Vicinamibacterales bacterium]|nr:NAD(+) synthase [Vicinamibacterales bacterium]
MSTDPARALSEWLRGRLAAAGARGFVVGLSGGIDSAVVARLCQFAAPQKTLGVVLPCYSHPQDEEDARLVALEFHLPTLKVDLGATFDALTSTLAGAIRGLPTHVDVPDIKQQMPEANIKPRLRMTSLYFLANSLNYLVAGTGNRCELALGYFTKYGDGGVDVLPIGHLLKSEVRALAKELGVPQRIVDKPPTAGLWMGQTDEVEMGFSYDTLEQYLVKGASAVPAEVARRIEQLQRSSQHKRTRAPVPDSAG